MIGLVVGLAAGVAFGWLLFSPREAKPIAWHLLGVAEDRRALIVLPSVAADDCLRVTGLATTSIDARAVRVAVTTQDRPCEGMVNAMDANPEPLVIGLSDGQLAGATVGGPGYRGVTATPVQRTARVPGVVGLRAGTAAAILKANGVSVATTGAPLSEKAVVVTQSPPGGGLISATGRSSATELTLEVSGR